MKSRAHQIKLEVECKSNARILRIPVKSFIVGETFDTICKVTNISNKVFPGGVLVCLIDWQSGNYQHSKKVISRLEPGEMNEMNYPSVYPILSGGYTVLRFMFHDIDGKDIGFISGGVITDKFRGHYIIGKTRDEIYQYWALLVSAASLLYLVLERIFISLKIL